MGFGVLVGEVVWAPVHGGAEGFRSSSEFSGVVDVASALHDIDLAASWPLAVFVVAGEHPDGGPQPVTFGQFGFHLNPTVLDFE